MGKVVAAPLVMRILIVDDDPQIRDVLNEQLRSLTVRIGGASFRPEIHFAENGRRALEKTQSCWFDVVITDLHMPEMSGLDLLGAIRGESRDTPIIMLTGQGSHPTSVEALRRGAYAYLTKPWKRERLVQLVTDAVVRGVSMRGEAERIEMKLKAFEVKQGPQTEAGVSAGASALTARHRQLRSVFRSMQIELSGLHRTDVCVIPPRVTVAMELNVPSKKKTAATNAIAKESAARKSGTRKSVGARSKKPAA